jgi:serine/threonine protein kinase
LPTEVKLVFEFVELDLKKYLKSLGRPMPQRDVQYLTLQLIQGLAVCHARGIIHRDIKPANLLINSPLRLKIADFGLARAFSEMLPRYTQEVVTLWYRAPEILLGSQLYSVGIDIWAVGCVFGEVATGHPLFAGDSEIGTLYKIFQKLGTPTEYNWAGVGELPFFNPSIFPKWASKSWQEIRNLKTRVGDDGVDLLSSMLVYDPKHRIAARQSLQRKYLKEVVLFSIRIP